MRPTLQKRLLGEVVEVASGQVDPTVSPYDQMPHVGGDNIESGSGRIFGVKTAAELTLISGKYAFQAGEILYSKIRPALNKVAIPDFDGICSADIYPLRVNTSVAESRYLLYVLRSREFLAYTESHSTRTNIPKVNRESLLNYEVSLPTLLDQRRIAGILDHAEALRAKRREALAKLDALPQAMFTEMFGDPVRSPKYTKQAIRPFVQASSGKSAKEVTSRTRTTIPIYGGNGVNGWATQALYDTPVLVFGRVGQQCGNTDITAGPAWVTDNAIVLNITDNAVLTPIYLLHAFRMTQFAERVKHLDLPFINQSMILDYEICLPPLPLQQEFANRVGAVEQLRSAQRASSAKLDELFAALQHRAFRGEL